MNDSWTRKLEFQWCRRLAFPETPHHSKRTVCERCMDTDLDTMTREQLIAEVKKLREALEWISDNGSDDAWDLRHKARQALGDA